MGTRLDELIRKLSALAADDPAAHETADELLRDSTELYAGAHVLELEPLNAATGLGQYIAIPANDAEAWPAQAKAADFDFGDPNAPKRYHISDWPDDRADDCSFVVSETCRENAELVGRATLREIEGETIQAMTWACSNYDPEKGDFVIFARAVARTAVRRVRERIGKRNLRLEKKDQDFRDHAVTDEGALAEYLAHVRDSVLKWVAWRRKKPLAVITRNEKHDNEVTEIVFRILELLRGPNPAIAFFEYERAGRPAFLQVRDQVLGRLRRRERIWIVKRPDEPLHGEIPRPDHALLRKEIRNQLAAPVYEFLHSQLTPALRIYLDALMIELQLDDRQWGIQDRIAKRLGRSKSRVSEALTKIRELARAHGVQDLLVDPP